jgi:hypothetical protein
MTPMLHPYLGNGMTGEAFGSIPLLTTVRRPGRPARSRGARSLLWPGPGTPVTHAVSDESQRKGWRQPWGT